MKHGVAEGSEHQQQDLDDVADWMNTTPDKLSVTVKQEPIEKFIKQIREMYGTYDEFPEDEKRTNRILKLLKSGANPLPIYVEAGDPYLFVMEGRHRMVAFWLAEMKSIPVAYVSVKDQQGVSEDITPDNNVKIDNHVESSFINGYNGLIIAHYNDKYAGYLRYHVYNDVPKIEMIYVNQDYRRRGIAMSMLKALQQLTPNEEIDWGYTTDYGTKLKQSIDFRKLPNTDIIKKKAKLAGLKSKLNRLNYRLEQIQDSNPELARKYVQTVSDRWNQYHDEIRKLEDALSSSKGEYSKLIPEAINNLYEKWSAKYKRSINCNNPRGFSQRAHCQGRKKK
jgi:archaellum component FlaC